MTDGSVLGNGGVHFIAPPQDSAHEVPDALETGGLELAHRFRAADAAPAVDDDVACAVEPGQLLGKSRERHETRAGNPGDLPLVWLAHVNEIEVVTRLLPLGQLARRDLREFAVLLRVRGRLRHAAELLIVNKRLDLVRAARWALGVLPQR